MAGTDLTKLSMSLIPIEDIQELLRYQFDFITKEDNATDTNAVAGVPAKQIAVAVSENDRKTVQNAQRLGNKPAAEYLTKEDGGHITQNYDKIRKVYSSEVQDLRDELYQLRGELIKRGIVTNYNPYSGFQDAFHNSDPVYMREPLAAVLQDSMVNDEIKIPEYAFKDLDLNDYIVLHLKDIDRFHVARVTQKMPDGETVKFAPASAFHIKGGTTDLHKSLGMYDNGSFAFMRPAERIPTTQEYHSTLNDDTNRTRRNIISPNTGVATTFRIPNSAFSVNGEPKTEGYLVRAKAKVTRFGTPGSLVAYIIREEDIKNFKNPQQAEEDGILVAKSQPVLPPAEQMERLIDFDFFDGVSYPIVKNDETVDVKTRFCLIIEATGRVDNMNYYRVQFLQHKDEITGELGDLQLNNIAYEYARKNKSSDEAALITDSTINSADLYYGIITRGIVTNGIIPYREGVYTSKINLQEPIEISRARLMLRVNREGYYTTGRPGTPVAGSIQDGNNLLFQKDPILGSIYDMQEVAGIGAKNHDDWVVVGKQFRKLINQNQDSIQLEKGVYLEEESMPIYRVGYKAYLKAIRKEYVEEWNEWKEVDRVKIELPLSAIMPDRVKRSDTISDRLLFQNEFVDADLDAKYFNEFELQIYWRTEYSSTFDNDRYKEHFQGRIHDLSLSFDKSI